MFKPLKKILLRLFLFIALSILFIMVSLFSYPRFYQAFMSLETISVQYSPDKRFKAEKHFIPYLHHSLGINIYRIYGGYIIYRITNIETGEVLGDMEDETFEAVFEFENKNKFCIDMKDAYNRPEDEWCLDLE